MNGQLFFLLLCFVSFLVVVAVLVSSRKTSSLDATAKLLSLIASNFTYTAVVYRGTFQTVPNVVLGKKVALLFGLNYIGTRNALYGCINDVLNLQTMLQRKGYSVTTLTDRTSKRPTYDTIVSEFTKCIASLGQNDSAFIWFSGHGTYQKTRNAWVPLDFQSRGFLYEDALRSILRRATKGARIFVGADCCNSGTFFDLKYDLEPNGTIDTFVLKNIQTVRSIDETVEYDVLETHDIERVGLLNTNLYEPWDNDIVERSGRVCQDTIMAFSLDNQYGIHSLPMTPGYYSESMLKAFELPLQVSSLSVPHGLEVHVYEGPLFDGSMKQLTETQNVKVSIGSLHIVPTVGAKTSPKTYSLYDIKAHTETFGAFIVFVSACRDNQVAYDAFLEGQSQGALTWAFLRSLASMPNASMARLQDLMREGLARYKFSQVPQVSFGSPLSPFTSINNFGF